MQEEREQIGYCRTCRISGPHSRSVDDDGALMRCVIEPALAAFPKCSITRCQQPAAIDGRCYDHEASR